MMISKLNFTKDKLQIQILELANLYGYQKPSTYLNDLLEQVRQFNSVEFEKDFFLNVHYICKENAAKFWSEGHRQDISHWLMKARFSPTIMKPDVSVNLFSTTWENEPLPAHQTEKKAQQSQPDFDKLLCEIKNSENKFVPSMPMEKVINHFKALTEKKSKNGQPFLTQEQLILCLQKAFLNKPKIEKQKINLGTGQKGYVIKRFYEFFVLAVADYNELNKKDKYIKLLSDNFTNWKSSTIKDMFKPNKTKANW